MSFVGSIDSIEEEEEEEDGKDEEEEVTVDWGKRRKSLPYWFELLWIFESWKIKMAEKESSRLQRKNVCIGMDEWIWRP